MKPAVDNEACPICGNIPYDSDRRVLVDGKARLSYCSQACLRVGVRVARIAHRKARLRRAAALLAIALAVAGVGYLRHLLRRPRPRRAAQAPPPPPPAVPPEAMPFGPHWPPTDDEWREQFARAAWVYPLPGPSRRPPAGCRRLFGGEPAGGARPRCRAAGRCGVDLGGELWGEHVYAALDGVIDRVRRSADDAPGGIYVRIAHFGGAVFTQYFHLAAIPTRLRLGMHVDAGEVIGLVGDTGLDRARPRLHFALSVRPSSELPEVYWDPTPLMSRWPVRTPARGSVAGLVSVEGPAERVAGTPSFHVPVTPRPAKRRRSGGAATAD